MDEVDHGPPEEPGARNNRSIRLPSAPPSTSERPTTINVSRVRRTARTRKNATAPATSASSGVNAWKRLKALPVFRTRRKSTVVPITENGASGRRRIAQSLLS